MSVYLDVQAFPKMLQQCEESRKPLMTRNGVTSVRAVEDWERV